MSPTPVYYDEHDDGVYCCIDGEPEYFRSMLEVRIVASNEERELIEITPENYTELEAQGAFRKNDDEW